MWHANIGNISCVEQSTLCKLASFGGVFNSFWLVAFQRYVDLGIPLSKKFWRCVWPDYAVRFLSPILTYSLGLLVCKSFIYSPWSNKDTINVLGEEFKLQYLKNITEGHIFQFEYELLYTTYICILFDILYEFFIHNIYLRGALTNEILSLAKYLDNKNL